MVTQKNGVSAKTVERMLGLSYTTAWTWLHKLREGMVNPCRTVLSGTVQVDETYLGAMRTGVRGRHKGEKALLAIAVEEREAGMGRARMAAVSDASAPSLQGVIVQHVAVGSTIRTDGWPSYKGLGRKGYTHVPEPGTGRDKDLSSIRYVHHLAGLVKRWLLGTHQGAVREKHLNAYLDEFVFRFNRRGSRHRTLLFQRLACQGMMKRARPYWKLVGRSAPHHYGW
jgi:transposase-like protein